MSGLLVPRLCLGSGCSGPSVTKRNARSPNYQVNLLRSRDFHWGLNRCLSPDLFDRFRRIPISRLYGIGREEEMLFAVSPTLAYPCRLRAPPASPRNLIRARINHVVRSFASWLRWVQSFTSSCSVGDRCELPRLLWWWPVCSRSSCTRPC